MLMKYFKTLLGFLVLSFVLTGCAQLLGQSTPPSLCLDESNREINQCFDKPEDAPSNMARLYVFRPNFGSRHVDDNPTFIIDDSYEVLLGKLNYVPFNLSIGTHHFKLNPGENDSNFWKLEGDFELNSPGRYYLAIWSFDVGTSLSGADIATLVTSSILTRGLAPTTGKPSGKYKTNAKYELVDENDALYSIRECSLSGPVNRVNATDASK